MCCKVCLWRPLELELHRVVVLWKLSQFWIVRDNCKAQYVSVGWATECCTHGSNLWNSWMKHVTWNGPPQLGKAGDEIACTLLGGFNSEEYWRRLHNTLHAEHRIFILQCLWKGINFCRTSKTVTHARSYRHTSLHVESLVWFFFIPIVELENKWSAFPFTPL